MSTDFCDDDLVKKRYHGHKCCLDFKMDALHDRSKLKNFSSVDAFLVYYEEKAKLPLYVRSDDEKWSPCEVKANKKLCDACIHSSRNYLVKGKLNYRRENDDKTKYGPCPLEKAFTSGRRFKLNVCAPKQIICGNCQRDITSFVRPDSYNSPEFHDLLCEGAPTVVEIARGKYRCPFCRERMEVRRIPGVEIEAKSCLTARLVKVIFLSLAKGTEGGIGKATKKELAEGYGIDRKTLAAYLTKEIEALTEVTLKLAASEMRRLHKFHQSRKLIYDVKKSNPRQGKSMNFCYYAEKIDSREEEKEVYWEDPLRDDMGIGYITVECDPEIDDYKPRLQMVFDETLFDTAGKWSQGDFGDDVMPEGDRLTILAHYYSAAEMPNYAHDYGFFLLQVILLYGQMLQKEPALKEGPATGEFIAALKNQRFYNDPGTARRISEVLYSSINTAEEERIIATSAEEKELLSALSELNGYITKSKNTPLPAERNPDFFASREMLLGDHYEIGRLQYRLEDQLSNLPAVNTEEDPEECYQTNADLVMQRLLLFNEAAIREALGTLPVDALFDEDGRLSTDRADFSRGVSVDKLAELMETENLFRYSGERNE